MCRYSSRLPPWHWMTAILGALLALWPAGAAAAPNADPLWCIGQDRAGHEATASNLLIQQASELAGQGTNEAAVSALCAAFARADVRLAAQAAGNVANFAGTILFRGPGSLDAAIAAFRDSIALSDERRNPSEAATAHANLGNAFIRKGFHDQAGHELTAAERIARTIGDADRRAASLASLAIKQGLLAEAVGDADLADSRHQQAARLADSVSGAASRQILESVADTRREAIHNLAASQSSRGNYVAAVKNFLELRDMARAEQSTVTEYWATFSLMLAYQELGRHKAAFALMPALDDLERRSPDAGLRASTLAAQARSLIVLGEHDAAMARAREAALFFGEHRMINDMAQALNTMGNAAMRQQRPQAAREAFQAALKGRRVLQDRVGEGITLGSLAGLAWREGQIAEALQLAEQAVMVLERTAAPMAYARALGSWGVALQGAGKRQEARAPLERSVDLLWRYRAVRQSSLLGSNENDRVRPIYDALIRSYLADGQDIKALAVAEQVRAAGVRSSLIGQPNTRVPSSGDAESQAVAKARDKAFKTQRARQESPSAETEQAAAAALRELDDAMARLELAAPPSERGTSSFPSLVSSLQQALGPSRALAMYHREEDGWLVFVVTNETVRAIDLKTSEPIPDLVSSFREFSWDEGGVPQELQSLYTLLIAPAIPVVGRRDLIVVPAANLSQLSFAALHDGNAYLAETRLVSYALGAGHALQMLTEGARPRGSGPGEGVFLAAARVASMNPLVHAETEVKEAAGKLPRATVAVQAGLKDYFALAPSAKLIHIAAHALTDNADPLLSRVLLEPQGRDDGLLSLSDVRRTRLHGKPLVVLSACESGLGKSYSDESVQALSTAFLQAGADAVIASLWLVDDKSSSLMMADFYKALAEGTPPSMALRGAMQRAIKLKPHPFYWAAFTYTGPL